LISSAFSAARLNIYYDSPSIIPIENGFYHLLPALDEKENYGVRRYLKRLFGKSIKVGGHSHFLMLRKWIVLKKIDSLPLEF